MPRLLLLPGATFLELNKSSKFDNALNWYYNVKR